jgi:hypothetical protein
VEHYYPFYAVFVTLDKVDSLSKKEVREKKRKEFPEIRTIENG